MCIYRDKDMKLEEFQEKRLKEFRPYTVQKRAYIIESIASKIKEKGWKHLDENKEEDLDKVLPIVYELYPLTHPRTAKDYARVSIILAKQKK